MKNVIFVVFAALIVILPVEKTIALDPQLESVNKQIEDLRNKQVRNTWSESSDVLGNIQAEEKANDSKKLGYILAVFLIAILAGSGLYNFNRPQNVEERRKRREQDLITRRENEKIIREKRELEQQERELKIQQLKEAEINKYQQLRKDIEQTPRYQRWKEEVKEKCGNKCQIDRSHVGRYAEVHHLTSFYKILKQNNITSIEKALGCRLLWDIDNGIVLCKECHDKMESSQNRQAMISKNNK
jgi:5-methylcytosine-specific restriction endonuclease McrA